MSSAIEIKEFDSALNKVFEDYLKERLKLVGKLVVDKANEILIRQSNYGHDSKHFHTLKYKVEGLDVVIYSGDEVLGYIEHGTKPHIIEPNKKKSLKFNVEGNEHFSKKVHHPGTDPRPFLSQAIFVSRDEIIRIMTTSI